MIFILNSILMSFSFSQIWGKVWPILIAILFFGLIIFIHEFGHFITAKLSKVRVNEFAIGMGPTIFKHQGKETTYALRLFPIGGFVSMEGEDEECESESSFNKKPIWKRMIIVAAGAVMNLLLGLVILGIYLSMQPVLTTNIVDGFRENATSSKTGLQIGDEIVSINGMSVLTTYDISVGMMRDKDGLIDFVVKRDGKNIRLENVQFTTGEIEGHKITVHDFYVKPMNKTFFSVVGESVKYSLSVARIVWLSLFDIITGQYGFNELSGPVGTVAIVGESASNGFQSWDGFMDMLMLMAFVTINIGVFNLLPIPALDGGRLFFLLIELVRNKPLNRKYEGMVNAAGLFILLGFVALVTFSDIVKLFKG